MFLSNLIPQSPALFQLLQLRVSALRSWLREDVEDNGGQIIEPGDPRPPLLAVVEKQLALPRTYTPPRPPDTGGLGFRMTREMYATFFQKIFSECNSDNPFASVKGDREFGAFFKVLECFQKDPSSISENESSALKASQLIVHFIAPPFFSSPCDAFTYKQQRPLSFPIFLSQSDQPEAWCKYTPTPYFMVVSKFKSKPKFKFEFPLIISEVGSKEDKSGRQQMLLQAIAFSRAGQYLMKPDKQFYMVAIYLRADMTVKRYVVALAEKPENKVLICQEDFDFCSPRDAVLFLREMHNLATMLEELVDRFDPEKRTSLSDIDKYARELLIAMVSNVVDKSAGFLKFVRDGRKEIPILQYLSKLKSPQNHTISGVQIWPVHGGNVILMPSAGSWLTSLRDPDAQLWSAANQLFEAVDFMHQQGVAHLDLKPANVLIPLDGGRLSIIDFHTSVRVEGVRTMLRGRVGTPGYMPPEVSAGHSLFSAVRADLCSCGKTLSELCKRCSPSTDREVLLQIARALMNWDPEERPMMSDVLERLADYKASGGVGMGGT